MICMWIARCGGVSVEQCPRWVACKMCIFVDMEQRTPRDVKVPNQAVLATEIARKAVNPWYALSIGKIDKL